MRESELPPRDQELYEKSIYLRVYSLALLDEAQELCRTSNKLRKTNASLTHDLRAIRGSLKKRLGDESWDSLYTIDNRN